MLARGEWTIRDLSRQAVQRRGSDRSVIFRVVTERRDIERRFTAVAYVSEQRPPGGLRPLLVKGRRVYVWRYPDDPFLPGLPTVTSNPRVRALLDSFDVVDGQPRLQRRVYRATRRAVIQADLLVEGNLVETVYCKVLGGRDRDVIEAQTQRLADHHAQLAAHLPVPTLIGVVPRDGILVAANVPGVTLRKAILDDPVIPAPAEVAGLALTLTGVEVTSDANPARYADPTRHAETIGELLPAQRARAIAMVQACSIDGPMVTVHGDFHDGQVLVEGARITGLIDIDGVGTGHLAHDAGRMIAYVESIGDIDRADSVRVDGYVAGLRAAFADHLADDTLARAIGAAWIALATGPHRRQQKDWEASTVRRLDHAERWLRQAGAL